MPPSGSNTRLSRAVIALTLVAVVAIGTWALLRSRGNDDLAATATAVTRTASPLDTHSAGSGRSVARSSNAQAKSASGAPPLPPPGAPLARTYDELKARADAGDPAAASRLYRDVMRCRQARDIVPTLHRMIDAMLARDDRRLAPNDLAEKEKTLASLQQQLAREDASRTDQCADLADDQLQIVPAALRAAQLGDDAAADCYVDLPFAVLGHLLDHPEWLVQYKSQALDVANAAVERGDWTMVLLLHYAYGPAPAGGAVGLLQQLTGTDIALAYRYGSLLRLGVVNTTDISAVEIDEQQQVLARDLSQATIGAADLWADDAYHRYFAGNPDSPGISHMSSCTNHGDTTP